LTEPSGTLSEVLGFHFTIGAFLAAMMGNAVRSLLQALRWGARHDKLERSAPSCRRTPV
jgi:hypothetical protein